jgi:hypothetical protein
MAEIIERARLPHDLPANREASVSTPPGTTPGPKKPALVNAFGPMGYDCRGDTGTFTLRRRTSGNLTVELLLDVGTWSNLVMAIFRVQGLVNGIGFKATLTLPVTRLATVGAQYPIGGPDRWQQIVDNLAALVAELDRGLVPAIEAASGPSPAWYRPASSAAAGGIRPARCSDIAPGFVVQRRYTSPRLRGEVGKQGLPGEGRSERPSPLVRFLTSPARGRGARGQTAN